MKPFPLSSNMRVFGDICESAQFLVWPFNCNRSHCAGSASNFILDHVRVGELLTNFRQQSCPTLIYICVTHNFSLGGNLSDLTSAIGDLRSSKGIETPSISVNLPGGKSVMGQGGVENKVMIWNNIYWDHPLI